MRRIASTEVAMMIALQIGVCFLLGCGGPSCRAEANNAIPIDTWTHVRATVVGTALTVYIDGAPAASGTFSGTRQANDAPLKLGVYPGGGSYWLDAEIDEIKVSGG